MNSNPVRSHLFDLQFLLISRKSLFIHVCISSVRMIRKFGNFWKLHFSDFRWQSWWREIQTHFGFSSTILSGGFGCGRSCGSFQAFLNSVYRRRAGFSGTARLKVLRTEVRFMEAWRGGRWWCGSFEDWRAGASCALIFLRWRVNSQFLTVSWVRCPKWRPGLTRSIFWRWICQKKLKKERDKKKAN